MPPIKLLVLFVSILVALSCNPRPQSDTLLIGVASNFAATAAILGEEFEAKTGTQVKFSIASTGKLYTLIEQGAPIDVFLAADSATPALCAKAGHCLADTQSPYAIGQLVLYGPDAQFQPVSERRLIGEFQRLAIANPRIAPYGAAAIQVLDEMKLSRALADALVVGDSVSQTFHFVETGAADLGFVSLAQVKIAGASANSFWRVPSHLHATLQQDFIQTVFGKSNPEADAFLDYLISPTAQNIIADHGFILPAPPL